MNTKSGSNKKESRLSGMMGLLGWGKKDKVSTNERKSTGHKTHRVRSDHK